VCTAVHPVHHRRDCGWNSGVVGKFHSILFFIVDFPVTF
jgi:hypothetical protein